MRVQLEGPTAEELADLYRLARALDDLLEESVLARENVSQTLRRCFPRILEMTGARAIALTTRNEEQLEQTYSEGDFGGVFPGVILSGSGPGVQRFGDDTLAMQPLVVDGANVGTIGLIFPGDRTARVEAPRVARLVDAVSEQLDHLLAAIHTAAEKHQLILQFNSHLANAVFEKGMDQAVLSLAQRVHLPGFLLVFRDAVRPSVLHYRTYRNGHLEFESGGQPFAVLDALVRRRGTELIAAGNQELREMLGAPGTTEAVLISGGVAQEPLGKILVWTGGEGFSSYTIDLVRVLASALSQRLMDYNRERIHLSQFFAADNSDELLQDPSYATTYLTPRDEEVGILFADINGFTRICEQVLESPARIGKFVDRWSDGVVRILWRHGGVFDKMVGDCAIGLFGPPFFRTSPVERAEQATRAALEIRDFTEAMSADPEAERIRERAKLPGLGVAVGVNLARAFCGLFGPNHQYTGFSTGMNQTARLQALGGFREILVMQSVRDALEKSADPFFRNLQYGPLAETPVKNVEKPLRHYRLLP
jgi:class 3 adenylate cyclase